MFYQAWNEINNKYKYSEKVDRNAFVRLQNSQALTKAWMSWIIRGQKYDFLISFIIFILSEWPAEPEL
jgi:hypothetical protein